MIKFNWKWPNGRRHAHIKVEYVIDADTVAYALIAWHAPDSYADDLPTDLKRAQVDRIVRELYTNRGQGWIEGGAYDEVPERQVAAFDAWAGDTVRRCYPELADDPALAKFCAKGNA